MSNGPSLARIIGVGELKSDKKLHGQPDLLKHQNDEVLQVFLGIFAKFFVDYGHCPRGTNTKTYNVYALVISAIVALPSTIRSTVLSLSPTISSSPGLPKYRGVRM
jgi:hypothetical protein